MDNRLVLQHNFALNNFKNSSVPQKNITMNHTVYFGKDLNHGNRLMQ